MRVFIHPEQCEVSSFYKPHSDCLLFPDSGSRIKSKQTLFSVFEEALRDSGGSHFPGVLSVNDQGVTAHTTFNWCRNFTVGFILFWVEMAHELVPAS